MTKDKFKEGRFTQKDSQIVFCAFRYCLGRMSYIVSTFTEYATAYIRHIWTHDLQLMEKEITEQERFDVERPLKFGDSIHQSHLGMECDKSDWLKLRDAIRKELKRRGER